MEHPLVKSRGVMPLRDTPLVKSWGVIPLWDTPWSNLGVFYHYGTPLGQILGCTWTPPGQILGCSIITGHPVVKSCGVGTPRHPRIAAYEDFCKCNNRCVVFTDVSVILGSLLLLIGIFCKLLCASRHILYLINV